MASTITPVSGILYTGISSGSNTAFSSAPGTTRWNTSTSQMEMFDGYQWQAVSAGTERDETMYEMVERIEDYVATTIEVDYKDNSTLQDAYKTWEEANERFKVILALAEKK